MIKVNYSPSYTTLRSCNTEYVKRLSILLEHSVNIETLETLKRVSNIQAYTNKYMFKAIKTKEELYDVVIYSGLISRVLKEWNKKIDIVATREKYNFSDQEISDVLRPHQKTIIEACLKNKRGIIKAATSSGKSFCIAELVRKLNKDRQKVLITVPTIDLLYQMKNDIENYFSLNNLDKLDVGLVGDNKSDYKDITIGIPNSLSKVEKTGEYLRSIDALISDECHMAGNATYAVIIEQCTHRAISLGFSATPELQDGLDLLLEGFFGPRICSISANEMIDKDIILNPTFYFYTAPKAFLPNKLNEFASNISNLSDGQRYKVLPQVYNHLIINNKGRNNLIINKAKEEIKKNEGPIIIVVSKVKGEYNHAEVLQQLLMKEGFSFPIISGYVAKKKRESIITDLRESKIIGVIAGPKVLTAGISIPSLSALILAGAGKSDTEFIQRVGRVLRKKEGKTSPAVIDFIDQQYWFKNQSNSRINTAISIYGKSNIHII